MVRPRTKRRLLIIFVILVLFNIACLADIFELIKGFISLYVFMTVDDLITKIQENIQKTISSVEIQLREIFKLDVNDQEDPENQDIVDSVIGKLLGGVWYAEAELIKIYCPVRPLKSSISS